MKGFDAQRVAELAGAELLRGEVDGSAASEPGDPGNRASDRGAGPLRVSIDTREIEPGDLFVGLPGSREDGGARAEEALTKGAWGVLVRPEHAQALIEGGTAGAVLVHGDPLAALQALARSWRAELVARGAKVVAVTGSTGKTSTKDILAALLGAHMRTAFSPANLNTEIGLPLAILAAPQDTEALVLELAMRGPGQIAELTAIADPDVGVIVNVGPAHLELLGSLENIAAAKAELIAGMRPGTTAVVPAGERLLEAHLRDEVQIVSFGAGGDVSLLEREQPDGHVLISHHGEQISLQPSFGQAHNLRNLLAAVAVVRALGYTPAGRLEVDFSAMRGQRSELPGSVLLIDDCYNANPMSMRAAIEDLAKTAAGRRVAVLGDMLELGPEGPRLHRELAPQLDRAGVELLVTVGSLAQEIAGDFHGSSLSLPDAASAAERVPALLRQDDTVLVKGSRGVGLELVSEALRSGLTQDFDTASSLAEAGRR